MSVCLTERRIEVYGGNSNGTVLADCIYSDFNIANYSISDNHSKEKTKKLWRTLFSIELIPMLISIGLMIYYNNPPGYGFMPGLSYLERSVV